jgi:hypothetical protein
MEQAQTQPETVRQSLQQALSDAGKSSAEKVEKWGADKRHFQRLRHFMQQLAENELEDVKKGRPSVSGALSSTHIDMDALYRHALACDQIMDEERQALDRGRHTPNSLVNREGVLQINQLSREAKARREAQEADAQGSSIRGHIKRAIAKALR